MKKLNSFVDGVSNATYKSMSNFRAELKWTHVGQYNPYGDTFRECEIHTSDILNDKDILDLVHNNGKLPKEEWQKGTRDIMVYFTGWYTITKTDYGYKYVGCEPYTD